MYIEWCYRGSLICCLVIYYSVVGSDFGVKVQDISVHRPSYRWYFYINILAKRPCFTIVIFTQALSLEHLLYYASLIIGEFVKGQSHCGHKNDDYPSGIVFEVFLQGGKFHPGAWLTFMFGNITYVCCSRPSLNMERALIFTHVCVDSSQTVLEHPHRWLHHPICISISQLKEKTQGSSPPPPQVTLLTQVLLSKYFTDSRCHHVHVQVHIY